MKIEATIRYTNARLQDKMAMGKRQYVDAASASPISVGIAELQNVLETALKLTRYPSIVVLHITVDDET